MHLVCFKCSLVLPGGQSKRLSIDRKVSTAAPFLKPSQLVAILFCSVVLLVSSVNNFRLFMVAKQLGTLCMCSRR